MEQGERSLVPLERGEEGEEWEEWEKKSRANPLDTSERK